MKKSSLGLPRSVSNALSVSFISLTALLGVTMATSVRAADGTEVIKESDKRTKSATEKTIYRMDLLDAFGKVQQSREIELYFKKGSDIESTLFKFTAPPVVQGTGLLIEDAGKSVNDIWMYVPATRRIRRISGTEKTNWFMGTEFTHEDFEDYKIASYSFNLAKEDSCGEKQTCYVIEATPSSPQEREASGYLKKIYWVEKTSLYPIRIDYVAKSGDVSKRLEVRKLAKQGKYWRPAAYEMHNLGNGRVTRLTALSREVDSSMDDFYVSQRYLRTE